MPIAIHLVDGRSVLINERASELEAQIMAALESGSAVRIAYKNQVHIINPAAIVEILITPDSDE